MQVLQGISTEIQEGEVVCIIGPSGSGKSTFLRCLNRLEEATSGEILVNGQSINAPTADINKIREEMGMVFQRFNLFPHLTVLDNIMLAPLKVLQMTKADAIERGEALLEKVGLSDKRDNYPDQLSGGQQQRVGITRALANNPPIIVADEPLGNLDSVNAGKVLEFLKELNEKDGRTIIMVTHEAWSLRDAQRIFYMKDGAIIKEERQKIKTIPISKHFQEFIPKAAVNEITAQTLAGLLLRGYSTDEVKRFQFFLLQRLNNNIDSEIFKNVLDRSYKNGGVGLWKQKAKKISYYVDEIVERKKDVEIIYKELEQNPESPLRAEIERMRIWLLEDYKGAISQIQTIRLDEVIGERLRLIIDSKQIQKIINLPQNKFGIGLSLRASQTMAEKIRINFIK